MRLTMVRVLQIAALTLASAALAQQPAPPPADAALAVLKSRPWRAAFDRVLAEANALGRDRFDPGFADLWSESEALGEAVRRIETGVRDNRPATAGAINDAIDVGAAALMGRVGCFVALVQRSEFAPQATALASLRVDGQLPEPLRLAVKQYAQGPCETLQSAGYRNFDPARAAEAGKRQLANAAASGALQPLGRYLNERGLLRETSADDQSAKLREAVEAEFRRFDGLYSGHAELIRGYAQLFADYCPTDQRFCAMREMLLQWSKTDAYCDLVTRYVAAHYGDASRINYLTGPENDGLNRVWEAYHLRFAPACVFLANRGELAPAVARRIDLVAPMFAADQTAIGENGVESVRAALRAARGAFDSIETFNAGMRAYRAASGLDGRVTASTMPASTMPASTAPASTGPLMPATPSDDELRVAGTAESERQLQLDRLMVRDIQERLLAIGSAVTLSGSMTQSTRAAIRSWQGAVGLEPTGFLTRPQIDLLKIRTQERWAQWRGGGAVDQPPSSVRTPETRRRPPRRRPAYVERGGGFSDIPGAIAPYSWRQRLVD